VLTSPSITLGSTSTLQFDTLWQIESVNPSSFDLMQVQIKPISSSGTPTTILQLNPASDAGGSCAAPYSSGTGFNGTPGVEHRSVDLASYANQQVQISFSFDTIDGNYNGFEGWYVDNILVSDSLAGTIFLDSVESGANGWTPSGSHGTAPGWHITTRRSGQFGHSWWYGNEVTGTYQAPSGGGSE